MKLAIIGLGRMGSNMARRLMRAGHEIFAFNRNYAVTSSLEKEGITGVHSLEDLPKMLNHPAAYWLMLPAGQITEEYIHRLLKLVSPGDILIDGGNSHFKDDIRRAKSLQNQGIRYLDVGTSGGIWGLERGYSLMIGGDQTAADHLNPIFKSLAPEKQSATPTAGRSSAGNTADQGYLYCGPAGAGHFVKMVHNGIEYGMMQALAEGFDILRGASHETILNSGEESTSYSYLFDLREISEVWRRGSVISSWLLDLIAIALNEDPNLSQYTGHVPDSGEGRWTVQAALEQGVPAHAITSALYTRFRSREPESFAEKLLSAMRSQFGGHSEAIVAKKAS